MMRAADWAARLELRCRGDEWIGPCPSCGGRDRFHVRDSDSDSGRAIVGCRGCIDHQSPQARREAYTRIVGIVWPRAGGPPAAAPRPVSSPRPPPPAEPAVRERVERLIASARLDRHRYLVDKGHHDAAGLVLEDGRLLVPARTAGVLAGAQTIDESGRKLFLRGSRMRGASFAVGPAWPRRRWVCEGYATALSVSQALRVLAPGRDAAVVAFSAGNVPAVADPARGDIVVADNDPGSGAGEAAARRSGCRWWMPDEAGDANDLHQRLGIDALIDALRPMIVR